MVRCAFGVWPLLLLFAQHAHGQPPNTGVALVPDHATLAIPPGKGVADGLLHVTLNGLDPGSVTLRATPLALGDAYAFIRFPDSRTDVIGLSDLCQAGKPCVIRYEVYDAWATGTYQGFIDAYTSQGKIGSTPIAVVHPAIAFKPVIASEAMHDGRLVFDATGASSFLLSVQNPVGSPPHHILLSSEPSGDTCQPISFAPADFSLMPGAAQTVIASVAPCLGAGDTRFATLRTMDADDKGLWTDTVVALSRHQPTAVRQLSLFGFVVLGSFISVLLNNIFPVSRIKNGLRNDLHRADETLRDCVNASPALQDSMAAEAMRLRLSLQLIHWYDANKLPATREAEHGVAALTAAAKVAQQISALRSSVDGAILSIATHAVITGKLRDAEEALIAGDAIAANDRMTEAQAKLTEAAADVAQRSLRIALAGDLPRLLRDRGILVDVPGQGGQPGDTTTHAMTQVLQQPDDRHPRIAALINQLSRDTLDLERLPAQEILDIERDYYVAYIWTEYVEGKLSLFADPKLAQRLPAFKRLADALLDCLVRNPKSEHTQELLELVRSDLTPDEIAESLARGEARIDCDPRPKYLETVNVAFAFTNPLLNDVAAARRLLTYSWEIDDGTTPPPNVERFRHYFRRGQSGVPEEVRHITLHVQVPFTDGAAVTLPAKEVRPRHAGGSWWKFEPMELASFTVSTAIAVVTAFGAHYAQNVPDVVTWSDWLSSFMLGFGLDQLRDTVTPGVSSGAPTQPATQPNNPAASHT